MSDTLNILKNVFFSAQCMCFSFMH